MPRLVATEADTLYPDRYNDPLRASVRLTIAAGAASACLISAPLAAQQVTTSSAASAVSGVVLSEVVVTARRRDENIQVMSKYLVDQVIGRNRVQGFHGCCWLENDQIIANLAILFRDCLKCRNPIWIRRNHQSSNTN